MIQIHLQKIVFLFFYFFIASAIVSASFLSGRFALPPTCLEEGINHAANESSAGAAIYLGSRLPFVTSQKGWIDRAVYFCRNCQKTGGQKRGKDT